MGEAATLLREFDFRKAGVPEKMLVLKIEQAVIDKGLSDAAERFLTIEPAGDGIRTGDIVRVSFPDEAAEDGVGQVQFSVGRHFFDPALEDALLGMTRGQTAELAVKGRKKPVTVLSVKRRNIPPLTDETVASIGIEGVDTIAGYRQHLVDRAVRRKRADRDYILTDYVEKQVLAQSAFTPVDRASEEYRACYDQQRSQARQMAAQDEGVSELDVLRRVLGQEKGAGEEAILSALAAYCDRQMQLLALGRLYTARDGVSYTLANCERELRQFAEMRGIPYEALLEQHSPEDLLPGKYIQYYGETILAHYEKQYTVVIE